MYGHAVIVAQLGLVLLNFLLMLLDDSHAVLHIPLMGLSHLLLLVPKFLATQYSIFELPISLKFSLGLEVFELLHKSVNFNL
jgi:hypothetical protein